ncbi:hypothetical protein SAMN04515625_1637 [Methanohalophilus halophilus]|uniref:Uncharacterized protein n=1 Tax=Methanohalophilus halophilus TaxID=2177 RepID=A0A1H2WKQ2_9EURY|nr:hypothetical protein SAMN04515625_1637 [Methanohalophilus halophilus]
MDIYLIVVIILTIIVSILCTKVIYDTYRILRPKSYAADEESDESK